MTTLIAEFKAADKKVTEIQEQGTYFDDASGQYITKVGESFDDALKIAQNLYAKLEALGIDPYGV